MKLLFLASNIVCMFCAFSLFSLEDGSLRIIIRGSCTLSDLVGPQFSSFHLNEDEDRLLNEIIIPAMNFDYDKMREALRGAYVLIPD